MQITLILLRYYSFLCNSIAIKFIIPLKNIYNLFYDQLTTLH